MSAPFVVAVSQRVEVLPERDERRDSLDQRLCAWLVSAGFLPVPVPNCLTRDTLETWLNSIRPRAMVLSGGEDIGSSAERDATERSLLDWAEHGRMPVLGLCRGMQMMSTWTGGGLKPVKGHVRTRHALRGIVTGDVNSFHNVGLIACPKGFEILATAEDGEIEAIRHASKPWEGWMWHPEREPEFSHRDAARLTKLFNA